MEGQPLYYYPPGILLGLMVSLVTGWQRSFRRDSQACIERLRPSLRILGKENIPLAGPCLVAFNHYHRPGFQAWWLAMGIAASLPVEMHWIMTGEWTFPGRWYARPGRMISRVVTSRLAGIYGFTTMPPMPPRPQDTMARAASVREVLAYARRKADPVLGFSPEGSDTMDGGLGRPPSGAGRFMVLLARTGMKFAPVGAYEESGVFTLSFGVPFELHTSKDLTSDEMDTWASNTVMSRIARQLPHHLRGVYQDA